jgi:hypothetical protein
MTEHDGVPWIVMEYINGQSLAAVLAGGARLPWENVASIGAKIGDPHLSATLNYLTSAVPLAIGIAALAARKLRPALVPAAVGATSYFAATAVVAWFALGFQDARTGGWVLLGWTVATVVAFLAFLKGGWPFAGRSVAVNWLSAVEMLMVVGLAITAIVRRPTTAS